VRLAEEMSAREETERLTELMQAEAEAEQKMAEAQVTGRAWVLLQAQTCVARRAQRREQLLGMARRATASTRVCVASRGLQDEDEAKQHAMMAAILMGEEEWVLEQQVRGARARGRGEGARGLRAPAVRGSVPRRAESWN
jgi:hypothetical protein